MIHSRVHSENLKKDAPSSPFKSRAFRSGLIGGDKKGKKKNEEEKEQTSSEELEDGREMVKAVVQKIGEADKSDEKGQTDIAFRCLNDVEKFARAFF